MTWVTAGPFVIRIPDEPVRPEHEHQAMMLAAADPHRRPIQVHDGTGRLVTGIPVSREEWAAFVTDVKAGALDVDWRTADESPS